MGLLPADYATLKALEQTQGKPAAIAFYRQGKQGPFADDYGDPVAMLAGARHVAGNLQLLALARTLQPGDILCLAPGGSDVISKLSDGPFTHALLCTQIAPPEFIEAIGATGNPHDPSNDHVRRSPLMDASWCQQYRILRPAAALPPDQRQEAIARAISFCEVQLGKSYDYTFSADSQPGTHGYYCSDLAYQAYASPAGAGINFPISKSPSRDQLVVAVATLAHSLDPGNEGGTVSQAVKFVNAHSRGFSAKDLAGFLVYDILPECRTTQELATTRTQRARLTAALTTLLSGKAFPAFAAANAAIDARAKHGAYDTPILGGLRRIAARIGAGGAYVHDLASWIQSSGMSVPAAIGAFWHIGTAMLPFGDRVAAMTLGPQHPVTRALSGALDGLCALGRKLPDLPLVGRFGLDRLAQERSSDDPTLVSPTDLALARVPYQDFDPGSLQRQLPRAQGVPSTL